MRLCFSGGMPCEEPTLWLITCKCMTSYTPDQVRVNLFYLLWYWEWLKNLCILLMLCLGWRNWRFRSILGPLSDRTHWITLSIYRLIKRGLSIIGGSRGYLLCLDHKVLLFRGGLLARRSHAFPMLAMMRFRNYYLRSCCYTTVKCSLLLNEAIAIRNH